MAFLLCFQIKSSSKYVGINYSGRSIRWNLHGIWFYITSYYYICKYNFTTNQNQIWRNSEIIYWWSLIAQHCQQSYVNLAQTYLNSTGNEWSKVSDPDGDGWGNSSDPDSQKVWTDPDQYIIFTGQPPMSKKFWSNFYSGLLYKISQDFLDIHYLYISFLSLLRTPF